MKDIRYILEELIMNKLQDIISFELTSQNINLLEFEKVKQIIADKAKSIDVTKFDPFFSNRLEGIAKQLISKPNQPAYSVFSMFKLDDFLSIEESYKSFTMGDELLHKYYSLQHKLKLSEEFDQYNLENINPNSIVWNQLAPQIVSYFSAQNAGAEIVYANFSTELINDNLYEFNELDFDGNELDDIQSKFNMYGNKYGFFVIKGMLNADQIKSLKQQSIKKAKQILDGKN